MPLLNWVGSVRASLAAFVVYMGTVHLISRAKINLTLEVMSRRPDGYHDIDSVAQVIDLRDELEITEAPPGMIDLEVHGEAGVPSGPDNLVYRACAAFLAAASITAGARCKLVKRIPAQSGLGGGSCNAAAAIVGLNALFETGLSREELANIASNVGSDAVLFVCGGAVRMRGRGEIVKPLPDAPELHLVVLKPDVGVSTAWAYHEIDRRGIKRADGAGSRMEEAIAIGDRAAVLSAMVNDFDPVVAGVIEEIRQAKAALVESGAETAMLAGSGAAVFGVFRSREAASAAAAELSTRHERVFVSRTLGRGESEMIV